MEKKTFTFSPAINVKPTYQGFIAFIDILGFREIINKRQFKTSFDEYNQFIQYIIAIDSMNKIERNYVVFSDTIVINTISNTDTAFYSLLMTCSKIFYKMIQMGIPIRGCISYGDYERFEDKERGIIIAGKPIIEAYDYERSQNWVGIMISPSVLEILPKLPKVFKISNSSRIINSIKNHMPYCLYCQRYLIPFHADANADADFDGFAILPTEINCSSPSELILSLQRCARFIDSLIIKTPSLEAQHKYKNTLKFLRKTKGTWDTIIKSYPEINTISKEIELS